jgi:hypothetical protein
MGVGANARVVESACDPLTLTEAVYRTHRQIPSEIEHS